MKTRQFIGWGFSKTNLEAVINCGEYSTPDAAIVAVAAAGLELAEVETVYRAVPPPPVRTEPDPVVLHVLRTTAHAGATYRKTEKAQTWRKLATLHALMFALSLAGVSASAQTLPAAVGVHLGSYHAHAPAGVPYNGVNPGLYARWASGLTLGAYRNSIRRNSVYAGWTITDAAERFGLTLGIVTGYDRITSGQGDYRAVRCEDATGCREVGLKRVVLPMLVPSVRVSLSDRASARISAVLVKDAPAVHLSMEWRL